MKSRSTSTDRHATLHCVAILTACVLLFSSCMSLKQHVPDGKKVLNKNNYHVVLPDGESDSKAINDALDNMKKHVKQEPNSHILGFGPRLSMRIYCLSNPKKNNFIHKYIRKKGQEPVIYDVNSAIYTCADIETLLATKGCFNSRVTFDSTLSGKYDININYRIYPSPRYIIEELSFRAETPEVDSFLQEWSKRSQLQVGDWYDLDKLNSERNKLVEHLRDNGYYDANAEIISYIVDTNLYEDNKLSIRLNVRNPQKTQAGKPAQRIPLRQYHLDKIYIYPNMLANADLSFPQLDTINTTMTSQDVVNTYSHIFNKGDHPTMKPAVINRALFLYPGSTYRTRDVERAKSSLQSLRNFRYTNILFEESPNSSDTNRMLDAKVFLLPVQKQRLALSLEINNYSSIGQREEGSDNWLTGGNLGAEMKLSYQNKNIFGGAEQFKAEIPFLVEIPKLALTEGKLLDNLTNFESGLNLSIDFPAFMFPFVKDVNWQRMRPHTIVNLGGNYRHDSRFKRLLMNIGFGYQWGNRRYSHQLMPVEMTYVQYSDIDPTLQSMIDNSTDARLKYQYENHFILDARYNYSFNTQQYGSRIDFNYLNLSLESAGNLFDAIYRLAGNTSEGREIFGVPFSQYVRLTTEYKHYFYFGDKNTFVTRALIGLGIPYNNSRAMPFEKGFYGGGPNTMRAWPIRQLGPGLFQPDNNSFERIGDIQLVVNLEYRFNIIAKLEGALFSDMGNVWLYNSSPEFPGGEFSIKNFPESIAIGGGIGIRYNISIVTLRLDFSIPVYDPGMAETDRWFPLTWKKDWKNFRNQFCFGIDYPF